MGRDEKAGRTGRAGSYLQRWSGSAIPGARVRAENAQMVAMQPATLTVIALLPLIGWNLYRRVRRMIGRQRLSRARPWVTVTLFPLLLAMLAAAAYVPPHPQPDRLVWLAAGLVLGGAAAVFGLRRTRFETAPDGLFYTPHARLGIAISALIVLRVVYRVAHLLIVGPDVPGSTEFALSPYTLGPVGVFSGYYVLFAAGLIRQRWRMLRAQQRQAGASC